MRSTLIQLDLTTAMKLSLALGSLDTVRPETKRFANLCLSGTTSPLLVPALSSQVTVLDD